jgi:precorrin-2 dehydrogenase/sirohydrochlorin ferrochelatase
MFPVTLDLSVVKITLIGGGAASLRRLQQLDSAGVRYVSIFSDNFSKIFWQQAGSRLNTRMPEEEEIKKSSVLLIADLPDAQMIPIVQVARSNSVLVNVEDRKEYCDFHFPSFVRRGDLLLSVSTAGRSPALAKRIREKLEKLFPIEWQTRLEELSALRDEWKRKGCSFDEIANLSNKFIDEKAWLEEKIFEQV